MLTQTYLSTSISTQHYEGGFLKQGKVFGRFAALSSKEHASTSRLNQRLTAKKCRNLRMSEEMTEGIKKLIAALLHHV